MAMLTRHSRICASPSRLTIRCDMTSRGVGCSQHAMRLGPSCWCKSSCKGPRASAGPIWGWTKPSALPARIGQMSGASTACTNACDGAAKPSKSNISRQSWIGRPRKLKWHSRRRALAGNLRPERAHWKTGTGRQSSHLCIIPIVSTQHRWDSARKGGRLISTCFSTSDFYPGAAQL